MSYTSQISYGGGLDNFGDGFRNMTQGFKIQPSQVPYRDAIRALEKMQQCVTPREKLQCLSESFGALKTAVVDFHKGKLELSAMDDILPLTIYVVSQADV